MKKSFLLAFILFPVILFAQQGNAPQKASIPLKFALVIGNGAYTGLSRLANPVNDADDVAAALRSLGFAVDKVLNGNLEQMENAVTRLKDNLGESDDAYGFFFYAGHGVQSGGENYLIPVDANIPSESYLRNRSLSVQIILDDLNEARNSLNVVVLDACRDNPFGWSRTGTRGLAMITRQPADSIIVYATSAGQQASDGEGRNGLFTGQLLNNLADTSLEVYDLFRRTSNDVSEVSGRRQIPAIYSQFFGTAYLGSEVSALPPKPVQSVPLPAPSISPDNGRDDKTAQLWTVGASVGTSFAAPLLIGTIHGTIAPLRNSFLELGVDAGFLSGQPGLTYSSVFPFVHYAFFMPFGTIALKGGWYAGAGGGYCSARTTGPMGEYPEQFFAGDLVAGVNIGNMLDVSYTLRTNFKSVSTKIAAGYTYRFR